LPEKTSAAEPSGIEDASLAASALAAFGLPGHEQALSTLSGLAERRLGSGRRVG